MLIRGRSWLWKDRMRAGSQLSLAQKQARCCIESDISSGLCNGPAGALVPKARSKAGEWEQSAFALLEWVFWGHCQPPLITLLALESEWVLPSGNDNDLSIYTCPNPTLRLIFIKGLSRTLLWKPSRTQPEFSPIFFYMLHDRAESCRGKTAGIWVREVPRWTGIIQTWLLCRAGFIQRKNRALK